MSPWMKPEVRRLSKNLGAVFYFCFGADMTQHWRIAGLELHELSGLLARRLDDSGDVSPPEGSTKIARITAVGGIAVI